MNAHEGHAHADGVDPDDKERVVPNRREKRALARKLKRPIVGRTGKPWPMKRKTGWPLWKREAFMAGLLKAKHDIEEIQEEAA